MSQLPDASAPRAILARYYRAMLDMNADNLADLYAVGAEHEFPFFSPFFPQRLHGREEIRSHYRAVWGAAPMRLVDVREVAVHETRDSAVTVAEAEFSAVTTGGKRFDLSFLVVMKVEDGLIAHLRDYMDALGAAHALDRLPEMTKTLTSRPWPSR